MNERAAFNPLQAQEVAHAFAAAGVDYLFIGKGGAILLGFPGTTQDVDVFPAKDADNGRRLVTAIRQLGFSIDDAIAREIIAGKDFVQLTNGPFDLDIVFAPDGIENYAEAKRRCRTGRRRGPCRRMPRRIPCGTVKLPITNCPMPPTASDVLASRIGPSSMIGSHPRFPSL
jgi:hypothetical protein